MIHLFGIKYATEIKNSNESMKSIEKAANINESYATEISKGVKLSKFVIPRTSQCTQADCANARRLS
ncbi:hypothetical protein CYQ88_03500 [Hydrogenovibrio sp. SC-1]|nr:hypothetical protein CYQ88_03500 [Hydrogenovibrio sp. SC-1]